jgi:hypothetical protein
MAMEFIFSWETVRTRTDLSREIKSNWHTESSCCFAFIKSRETANDPSIVSEMYLFCFLVSSLNP